jgi:hypothetical protein
MEDKLTEKTVGEAQKARIELERQIGSLICEYENAFDVEVHSMRISHLRSTGMTGRVSGVMIEAEVHI